MLTYNAQVIGKTNQTVDVKVTVTASQGSTGIDTVRVTAIDYKLLDTETPNGCPASLSFVVNAVPLTALPLYVEGIECQKGVDQGETDRPQTFSGPMLKDVLGIADCKAPGQNQNNQTCINLQNTIQSLRNQIFMECDDADQARKDRDGYAGVAAVLAVAIAFLMYVAAVMPWPWNLIPAALALALFAAWVVLVNLAVQAQFKLNGLLNDLKQKRIQLSRLVDRLNDVCCPEFITVPRDVPMC